MRGVEFGQQVGFIYLFLNKEVHVRIGVDPFFFPYPSFSINKCS
jgi:hypothetical protein